MSVSDPPPNAAHGFRLAVLVEGAIGLVAVGLARLFGVSLRDQFASTRGEWLDGILAGVVATLPMFVIYWWMTASRWSPMVALRRAVKQMVSELFPAARLPELAIIACLAGVGEELLFRGVLQTAVTTWTTPAVGLAVASLVFGALHAVSRLYFVLATAIGLYLGWLLLEFENLLVPIVAHTLYDFVALIHLTKHLTNEAEP